MDSLSEEHVSEELVRDFVPPVFWQTASRRQKLLGAQNMETATPRMQAETAHNKCGCKILTQGMPAPETFANDDREGRLILRNPRNPRETPLSKLQLIQD